jgi:hypothetical protein
LNTQFCSDTVFAAAELLKGDKCAQALTTKDFIVAHSMHSKQECAQALQVFAEDIGIPSDLRTDGAAKLTGLNNEWRGCFRHSALVQCVMEETRTRDKKLPFFHVIRDTRIHDCCPVFTHRPVMVSAISGRCVCNPALEPFLHAQSFLSPSSFVPCIAIGIVQSFLFHPSRLQ